MSFDEEWDKRWARRLEIHCPHCDHLQPNDEFTYPVTYWAEDGPHDYVCGECNKPFFVKEEVMRSYLVAATAKELLNG